MAKAYKNILDFIEQVNKPKVKTRGTAGPSIEEHRSFQRFRSLRPDDISKDNLHTHLRVAMELELATIPAYLTALYSMIPGDSTLPDYHEKFGDNAEAGYIIRSVMMEEMLHFTLAGNVLTATGGMPEINCEEWVPKYPTPLPHSDASFEVPLGKFEPSTIEIFCRIELPTPEDAKPRVDGYSTIGQFYHGVKNLLKELVDRDGEAAIFDGNRSWQIDQNYYYGGGGEIVTVVDLDTANEAIDVIMEQGEGSEHSIFDGDTNFGEREDLAHFYKYIEILFEQKYAPNQTSPDELPRGEELDLKYDQVYNIVPQRFLKTKFFPPEVQEMSNRFNRRYKDLLDALQDSFTGNPQRLIEAVGIMYDLRYGATELMRIPIEIDGVPYNAGPTFEFLE